VCPRDRLFQRYQALALRVVQRAVRQLGNSHREAHRSRTAFIAGAEPTHGAMGQVWIDLDIGEFRIPDDVQYRQFKTGILPTQPHRQAAIGHLE
jgi:hypothetical protein